MREKTEPGEYIWAADLRDRSISCVIAELGIKTYGELSQQTPDAFINGPLDESEIRIIQNLLLAKGFRDYSIQNSTE